MAVFFLLFRSFNVFEAVQFDPVLYAIKPLPLKTTTLLRSSKKLMLKYVFVGEIFFCVA